MVGEADTAKNIIVPISRWETDLKRSDYVLLIHLILNKIFSIRVLSSRLPRHLTCTTIGLFFQ